MNKKHTPGKWEFSPWGGQIKVESVERTPGLPIVKEIALCEGINAPANARLIAAAPELLDALVWMVDNDETNEGDTPMPDLDGATWNEINAYWINGLNRARAAIAKATGEQA